MRDLHGGQAPRRRWPLRLLIVVGAVSMLAVVIVLRDGTDRSQHLGTDRLVGEGWQMLEPPLSPRDAPLVVATSTELLVLGGQSRNVTPLEALADGAAYSLATESWRRLPDLPIKPAAIGLQAVSTTSHVIVVGTPCTDATAPGASQLDCEPGGLAAAVYDSQADRWRELEVPAEWRGTDESATALGWYGGVAMFRIGNGVWSVGDNAEGFQFVSDVAAGLELVDTCLVKDQLVVIEIVDQAAARRDAELATFGTAGGAGKPEVELVTDERVATVRDPSHQRDDVRAGLSGAALAKIAPQDTVAVCGADRVLSFAADGNGDAWQFVPEIGTWETMPRPPSAPGSALTVAALDNKTLIFGRGGYAAVFEVGTSSWNELPRLPGAMVSPPLHASVLGDHVAVLIGTESGSAVAVSQVS